VTSGRETSIRARVSMKIAASASTVYEAFVEPAVLTRFWLASASEPLAVGRAVRWAFLVPGAEDRTTATALVPGRHLAWRWSDGTTVDIELDERGAETAITLVNEGFLGDRAAQIEAALNATEGFALVLADLKTLLENGTSAGIVAAKASLIVERQK
jgi:uncharacterized protein YndB with AHSA1/START domain